MDISEKGNKMIKDLVFGMNMICLRNRDLCGWNTDRREGGQVVDIGLGLVDRGQAAQGQDV